LKRFLINNTTQHGARAGFRLALFGAVWLSFAVCSALALETNVVINEFMALNDSTLKNKLGKYEDWVELHNTNSFSVSLKGWYLTDDAGNLKKWKFPTNATTIAGNGFLLVWADDKSYSVTNNELHTNFKLSGDGEYLALVKPDGATVVSAYAPTFPQQYADMSYGIGANGEPRYFAVPTPGKTNAFASASNEVADTKFNPDRGFYSNAVAVTITCATAGSEIRYTTNGSAPTNTSTLYTGPLAITNTTCLRAAAYKAGFVPADADTHTYLFVNDVIQQTVFSDTIRNNAIWGPLLDDALLAIPTVCLVTPNALSETEHGVSIEMIFPDGKKGFQINGGAELYGGHSLEYPKNSIRLSFKAIYGSTQLKYDLFGNGATDEFDQVLLRGGSHDGVFYENSGRGVFVRQGWIGARQRDMGQPAPHNRYVHLYINGTYWGQYDLMERPNAPFLAAYLGGVKEDYDALHAGAAVDGDTIAWNAMVTATSDYAALQSYMNVTNYADYMLLQFYGGNDWDWKPEQNWMAGRKRRTGAGYCFFCWDNDMDLRRAGNVVDRGGPGNMWTNIKQHAEFRILLADRAQKWFFNNGPLTPDRVIAQWDEIAGRIETSVIAETARWGYLAGGYTPDTWRQSVNDVKTRILLGRTAVVIQQLRASGVFPSIDAPVFSRFGGLFTNNLNLTVTAGQPIYYTLDNRDPRQYGTGAAVGTLYTNGVALTRTTCVKARALSAGGEWSALTEAVFTLAEKPDLRVTELMVHPRKAMGSETNGNYSADDFEFVELQNAGAAPIGLAGLHFTQGVAFDFTDGAVAVLDPGAYLLVVKNIAAFTNRYPWVQASKIAGVFAFPSTSLDNAGEKIAIEDAVGRAVVSFTYNDKWLPATDGAGHSLVPLPGVAQADGELDYPGNWRASVYVGGSPGQAEPAAPAAPLVLNEILAHTDPDNDGIELYNTTNAPITLGVGWYLSDDPQELTQWAIPATNTIAAHGWRYFDETNDFHNPITSGFGLNKAGEQVLLSYLPGMGTGQFDRVVDAVSFKGEENGVPLIRYPDGADSWFDGVPTPGASNQLAAAGLVIAEVMYHPKPTAANPENNKNDQFVELYNPTSQAIGLTNIVNDVGGAWRLAGGIGYLFPSNTVLPAGGRLVVVSFDPATDAAARTHFLAAYGLTNGQVSILGPYSGQLNNKTDTVRLERPVFGDPPALVEDVSWHVIDPVTYYDAAPWPTTADGTGRPLARRPGRNNGDDAASWVAGLWPTPGYGPAKVVVTAPTANTGFLAPVSITVTAEVDMAFVIGTVSEVVFAVDGTNVASDSSAPYTASVALNGPEGVRRLTARLTDGEGVYTSLAVEIMVYTNVPAFTGGLNQTINLTVTSAVGLHAAAEILSGMTQTVSFVWSYPGGGSVAFGNPTQAVTTASFTQPGTYELLLTMVYGQFHLASNRFVVVTVTDANTTNRVPYRENFEGYELGSTLVGVKGWYGAGAGNALIETNRYAAGPGGYPIAGAHERSLTFDDSNATNPFEQTGALTNVCVDMLLACRRWTDAPPEQPSDIQFGVGVTSNGHVAVWHGQIGSTNRWTELTDVTVNTNAYLRLTALADYNRNPQGWFGFRLWINSAPVTQPTNWFATANTNRNFLGSIAVIGPGQVDDLVVSTDNPFAKPLAPKSTLILLR
jgi:hypothetical protein